MQPNLSSTCQGWLAFGGAMMIHLGLAYLLELQGLLVLQGKHDRFLYRLIARLLEHLAGQL